MSGGLWDDAVVVSVYSRRQAIEDGTLVDLTSLRSELGMPPAFKFPLACTQAVFASCVELTPGAARRGEDVRGRLHDLCWMLAQAIQRTPDSADRVRFQLLVTRGGSRPERVDLVAVCGPGDDAEPVITVMLPGED